MDGESTRLGRSATADAPILPPSWSSNARAVFDALLTNGDLTRGDIAEMTGLSRVTASGVVEQLLRRGFVAPSGMAPRSSGGPNARTYALVRTAAYAVGVAAYLDRIVVSAAAITGDILSEASQPIAPGEDNAGAIAALVRTCLQDAGAPLERLRRIVVGTQGVVDPGQQEHLLFVTNIRSWQRELTGQLRDEFDCPVGFENDVNLAAFAELSLGAGRGVQDLVFAWVDEGVALGLIVDGRLLRGDNGWAGEIGFIPSAVSGPADHHEDATGRLMATLQNAASIPGLNALGEPFGLPPGGIVSALRAGFPGVAHSELLYDEIARRVALAIGPPILMLDPDIVVLAGAIAEAGGQRLVDALSPHLKALGGVPTEVRLSQLTIDPIVRGAVLLAVGDARDDLFVAHDGRRSR